MQAGKPFVKVTVEGAGDWGMWRIENEGGRLGGRACKYVEVVLL